MASEQQTGTMAAVCERLVRTFEVLRGSRVTNVDYAPGEHGHIADDQDSNIARSSATG